MAVWLKSYSNFSILVVPLRSRYGTHIAHLRIYPLSLLDLPEYQIWSQSNRNSECRVITHTDKHTHTHIHTQTHKHRQTHIHTSLSMSGPEKFRRNTSNSCVILILQLYFWRKKNRKTLFIFMKKQNPFFRERVKWESNKRAIYQ